MIQCKFCRTAAIDMAVTKEMCDWIQVHEKLGLEEDCPSLFEHRILWVGFIPLNGMMLFSGLLFAVLANEFPSGVLAWVFTVEMLAVSWKRCY